MTQATEYIGAADWTGETGILFTVLSVGVIVSVAVLARVAVGVVAAVRSKLKGKR